MTELSGQPLRAWGFRAFLATQFLGAFNDNLFKLLICFLATRLYPDNSGQVYIPLAGAMLTLPFLVFSSWAGHVADHFSKQRVMVWVKVAEIAIMSAGFVAFCQGNPRLLLVLLFLMGAQSAFFGPAKYGFLPETLAPEWLSRGNGLVQMWTFLAIILGTACAGGLAYVFADLRWAALVCVGVAVAGTLTSLGISRTPPGHRQPATAGRGLLTIWRTLREIGRHQILRRSLLGNAYFWFLAALFQLNILLYAQQEMGASELLVGILTATVALGIGFGSNLAGRISGDHIEFRLVPLGAIGIGVFATMLFFVPGSQILAMAGLACLGISAGFFSLPLATAMQRYSPPDSRGRYLGTNNFVTFSAMTLAAGFLALVLLPGWVRPGHVFLLSAVSAFAVLVVMFRREPSFLSRFAMWAVPAPFYRFRVQGGENVPETGGALLVCNHISFADAPAVQSALRRPVRFLIHKSYYEKPFYRFFASRLRCIPVAAEDRPKELIGSLRAASEAIQNGDLVCIFPESMISRLGVLLPFRRGIELIMRRLDAPIIPLALGGLWGDQSSFRWGAPFHHGVRRWLNRPLRQQVAVRIGAALPTDTASWAVRERVAELLVEAEATLPTLPSPGELLLRRAFGGRGANGDLPEATTWLRSRAVRALATAWALRPCLAGHDRVALLPDADWVRGSDALSLLGKTIVASGDSGALCLGATDLPLPNGLARLRARLALAVLPPASLARRCCAAPQPLHGNLSGAAASGTARRIADAFRIGPEDTLACPATFALAPWFPLVCGCRLAGPGGTGTVLLGNPDSLRHAPAMGWRLVIALCSDPGQAPPDLAARFGDALLVLTLADDGLTPLVAELPEALDGIVHQAGRQPGTAGLALPGTVIRAMADGGQLLAPGMPGTLQLLGPGGIRDMGAGRVDADGFVSRLP